MIAAETRSPTMEIPRSAPHPERLGREAAGPTWIRRIHTGAPVDAVSLGLGEPSWPLPEVARAALSRVERVPYGPQAGDPELRQAVGEWEGVEPERVLLTAGAQGALALLCETLLAPGDQVLVPDPGFPAYGALARRRGAEPVPYGLDLGQGFRLEPQELLSTLDRSPRARMVVVNHPANPTSGGASAEALITVARACAERGVWLVSDEVYRELYLRERPAGLDRDLPGTVVLGSMSKAWASPGLRLGWMIADPELVARCLQLQAWWMTSLPIPSQRAGRALLEASERVLPAARAELAARWQVLREVWREELGCVPEVPDGGWYCWFRWPQQALADPLGFALAVRDRHRVVVVPGLAFGERGFAHGRLCFAARPEHIRTGVRRLARAWEMAS